MSRLYGDDPPFEQFATYYRNVWDLMENTWSRCLKLGLDVVVDMNFWRRVDRDTARAIISAAGANCRLYDLQCPENQAWRRIEARNENLQGSLLITRHTFELLKPRFEPLGNDEESVTVPS